ncbi:hypothetical protein TVAG_447190 [Trichomonas vaginalis G3]|uniref:Uncharacterized protein n=1 Tax=Trichomonas vaginalis (strain ATCC PRA-98 / G3) TaxID=412133 RepID=A2DRZ1_TRIV3|nr:hypothetical protein TVAGG3_1001550 [Trichomonas vaginalis G3]EAY16761.1 hypothetical protein TVAG_447190 [Trichomonas vaginalis G3]KAI5490832.1 hypothetical protein TVAGG3_1001550 [Trichomonas vaginalis G3]|eukprot:XP_001328984.1 hypothetical protein [Trichomonas vaginalis G3]
MSSGLEKKSIQKTVASYSSSVDTSSSLEENSPTKEALIDKMQVKFGQMLKDNQELYTIKTQNEKLKSIIENLEKQLESTKQDLQTALNQKEEEKNRYEERILQLSDQIHLLEAKNIELTQENERLKDTIHTEREFSISEIQNQKTKARDDLSSRIAMKDQQINELKSIIKDLSDDSSSSNSALQAKIEETRKLKRIQSDLDTKLQNQNKIITNLTDELNNTKKDKEAQEQQVKDTLQQLSDLQNQFTKSHEIIKAQNEENKKLKQSITSQESGIQRIASLLPSSKTSDDCVIAIKHMIEENQQLQNDMNIATQRLKKAADVIRQNQELITALSQDIDAERMKNIHLKKVIEDGESKNERLINQVKAYTQIRSVTTSLEGAFQKLSKQFESFQEELGRPKLTLKSIINTAILVRRWNYLIGTDQYYVSDQRNWWWLDSSMYHTTSIDIIKNYISKIADEKKAVIDENDHLKELLRNTISGIDEAEAAIVKMSKEKEDLNNKLKKFEEMSESLNSQLNGMKYIDVLKLSDDFKNSQIEIQSLNNKIQNLNKNIEEIKASKAESENKASAEVVSRKRYQKENEYLRAQIEALSAKVIAYEKCAITADKEILALERANNIYKNSAKDAVRQGFVVTKHNQKLASRVQRQRNEIRQMEKEKKELQEAEKGDTPQQPPQQA